jgi:hypothetical protein
MEIFSLNIICRESEPSQFAKFTLECIELKALSTGVENFDEERAHLAAQLSQLRLWGILARPTDNYILYSRVELLSYLVQTQTRKSFQISSLS